MVKSLVLHEKHNLANGRPAHYARLATYHAESSGAITHDEASTSQLAHKQANYAKHEWHEEHLSDDSLLGADGPVGGSNVAVHPRCRGA